MPDVDKHALFVNVNLQTELNPGKLFFQETKDFDAYKPIEN